MSKTPRTDALEEAIYRYLHEWFNVPDEPQDWPDFARTLEMELNALKEENERLKKTHSCPTVLELRDMEYRPNRALKACSEAGAVDKLKKQNACLRELVERLLAYSPPRKKDIERAGSYLREIAK